MGGGFGGSWGSVGGLRGFCGDSGGHLRGLETWAWIQEHLCVLGGCCGDAMYPSLFGGHPWVLRCGVGVGSTYGFVGGGHINLGST